MPKRNIIWAIVIVAAALAALVFTRNQPQTGRPGAGTVDPVSDALHVIRERGFYDVDHGKLRRAAIEGIVSQLDPHSTYFPPGQAELLDDRVNGLAFGLGLRYDRGADGHVEVIGPLPGSPALRGELWAGVAILAIDSRPVAEMDANEVHTALHPRKMPQRPIRLLVRRPRSDPEALELRPEKYPIESVQGFARDAEGRWVHALGDAGTVVYLRLREFLPDTARQTRGVLREARKVGGVILDLRGNPGGNLSFAVDVCDLFLREGLIVVIEHREGRAEKRSATSQGTFPAAPPIVALTDANTASGAELLAAALQVHGRAVLLGSRTHGKGTVQSMIDLKGGLGRLNLTTGEFYVDPLRRIARRKGADVWGVDPDIRATVAPDVAARLRRGRLQTEVSPGPAPTTRPADSGPTTAPADLGRRLLALDAPLRRALALLGEPDRISEILRRAAAARDAAKRRARNSGSEE